MKARSILFSSSACVLFAGSTVATPVVFDFESAIDNLDGTVSNIGALNLAGEGASLALVSFTNAAGDTSTGLQVTAAEGTDGPTDEFLNVLSNFTSTPEGANPTPFNQLVEAGGTLTADVVLISEGSDNGTSGNAAVFLAAQGDNFGFTTQDGDGNFRFTGTLTANVPITIDFSLPDISGTNDLIAGDGILGGGDGIDNGNGFFGITLGVNNVGEGAVVVFDNITFTPIPEPGTMALLGLGSVLVIGGRRRRAEKA